MINPIKYLVLMNRYLSFFNTKLGLKHKLEGLIRDPTYSNKLIKYIVTDKLCGFKYNISEYDSEVLVAYYYSSNQSDKYYNLEFSDNSRRLINTKLFELYNYIEGVNSGS